MQRTFRSKAVVGALALLLTASLVANLLLYRQATRPLFDEGDRPLIERTIAHFVREGRTSAAETRAHTFPIVMRVGELTCVELRRPDRLGHMGACYDRRGRLVQETASVVN